MPIMAAKPQMKTSRDGAHDPPSRLLALRPHDDRGHVRGINGGIEKFRAAQLGEMQKFVSDFLHFPSDLLAAFHSQIDRLTDVLLENADDSIAGLQVDFVLGDQIGASEGKNNRNKE